MVPNLKRHLLCNVMPTSPFPPKVRLQLKHQQGCALTALGSLPLLGTFPVRVSGSGEEEKGAKLLYKSLVNCPDNVVLLLSTEKMPFFTLSKLQTLLPVATYLLIQLFQKQK